MRYAPLLRSAAEPAPGSAAAPSCAPAAAAMAEAQIAVALGEHRFLLADGRVARQALSCVVAPEIGDRVLAAACAGGELFILHLLQRADPALAELSVPGAAELRILQARITVQALDQLALHSLRDLEVGAATGLLSMHADNMATTVNQALVQNMRHYVGNAEQYLLDVHALLRLQGQQTIICAERDVKLDGQRISVG